jgi:fermentation-respiration switch protein FrsA (DUF1100 family)
VLIAHGTADRQVPLRHAELLIGAAGEGTESWIVEDAKHCIYTEDGLIPHDSSYRRRIVSFLDQAFEVSGKG